MIKKIFSFIVAITFVFSTVSCGVSNNSSKDNIKLNSNILQKDKSDTTVKKPEKNRETSTNVAPTEKKESKIVNTVNKSVYQNTQTLDNTTYGWGMRVLPDHKTPEITSLAMKLIKKYDGIFTGDTSKKVVYLTFDEGYENGYTPQILDILKENNVKAAFFVTGPYIKEKGDLVKRMVEEGHIVGNHSVNHYSMPSLSDEKVKEEINKLADMFKNLTGKEMHYFRPPKGEYSERTLYLTQQLGYKTVFWSIALADWKPLPGGPDESYNTVMKRLHPGAVILLHAVSKDDTLALDKIIKDIKAQGYEFKTLDDIK